MANIKCPGRDYLFSNFPPAYENFSSLNLPVKVPYFVTILGQFWPAQFVLSYNFQ